jgi:hypothetical protein
MKACKLCEQTKPLAEFRIVRSNKDGHDLTCKQCVNVRERARHHRTKPAPDKEPKTVDCQHCGDPFTYVKNRGQQRIYCSERCKANAGLAKKIARQTERRCACGSEDVGPTNKPVCPKCLKDGRRRAPENRRRRLLMYGLAPERFDEMLVLQRNKCGICATDDPGPRGWFIDHDHACCPGIGSCGNCVRGLLCSNCNLVIGHAGDSVAVLEQAKKYLISNSQFRLPFRVVET